MTAIDRGGVSGYGRRGGYIVGFTFTGILMMDTIREGLIYAYDGFVNYLFR